MFALIWNNRMLLDFLMKYFQGVLNQ